MNSIFSNMAEVLLLHEYTIGTNYDGECTVFFNTECGLWLISLPELIELRRWYDGELFYIPSRLDDVIKACEEYVN